jgi:DNA-binding CsgD family transcriptional regulator/PAS domain-containing protein
MNAVRAGAFERVTQQFFEAAAVPELWPAALHDLAQACGAEGIAVHRADGVNTLGTVVSKGSASLYPDFVTRWRAPELNSHRARGLALLGRGWRGAFTENDIFTPEQLAGDPFQQEFISPAGFTSFAGMVLAKTPGVMLSASIYRRPQQGPFQSGEIEQINKLVAQLRGAGEIALRVGLSSARRMADAFTAAGHPIALIRVDGRIIEMSPSFERLIGSGVHVKGGRLGASEPNADRAIAAAVNSAIHHDGLPREPHASVVLPRRNGLRPLLAQVVPVVGAAHDILHLVAAIAILTDLEAAACAPAETELRRAFGLSPAEARLAAQIAGGRTLPDIAQTEGMSRETLRSRLKSIFDKTGTSRQAELVLLLSKFAAVRP